MTETMEQKRILIIDEEKDVVRSLWSGLKSHGSFRVELESHAGRALDSITKFKPHLIFLDATMLDGSEDRLVTRAREEARLKGFGLIAKKAAARQR